VWLLCSAPIPVPDQGLAMRDRSRVVVRSGLSALVVLALIPLARSRADDAKKPDPEKRVAVGKCVSQAGILLQRQSPDKDWQPLGPLDAVHTRDLLLALPGTRAVFTTDNGALRVALWGNTPTLSDGMTLESAIVLHDNPKRDLDFTLERGRVVFTNRKEKPATVAVRVRDEVFDLELKGQGASVALERVGRWPQGMPFRLKPKKGEEPTNAVVFLVLKGTVVVKTAEAEHLMKPPPGAAYFHWDSAGGFDPAPQPVNRLPKWADVEAAFKPEAAAVTKIFEPFRQRLKDKSAAVALRELLASADRTSDKLLAADTRRLAVYSIAALDDLSGLIDALADAKHADTRETAIEALRHWIGRQPGQDQILYDFLKNKKKYSAAHAAILMHLLHSHSDVQLTLPDTYELLIEYLRHDKLPIRVLAQWHLYRIVPGAKSIVYDPTASPDQRQRAYKEWKKLIPDGELPKLPRDK
jgi:hypothetical protein